MATTASSEGNSGGSKAKFVVTIPGWDALLVHFKSFTYACAMPVRILDHHIASKVDPCLSDNAVFP